MFKTRNDLAEKTRSQACEILNARLLDTLHLGIHAKDAHWNVKGPDFIQLHELFDKIAGQAQADADELAERIAALGGKVHASAHLIATASKLSAYPEKAVSGQEHVTALADSLAVVAKEMRQSIKVAAELGDDDTADLFTGLSRELDKNLWFVESHLNAEN